MRQLEAKALIKIRIMNLQVPAGLNVGGIGCDLPSFFLLLCEVYDNNAESTE